MKYPSRSGVNGFLTRSPSVPGPVPEGFFNENVAGELRLIRRGRKRLVTVAELERWAAENSEGPMVEQVRL